MTILEAFERDQCFEDAGPANQLRRKHLEQLYSDLNKATESKQVVEQRPHPDYICQGAICWYRPFNSIRWFLGRFQQWVTYATVQYPFAMVIKSDGTPVEVKDIDISFSTEEP